MARVGEFKKNFLRVVRKLEALDKTFIIKVKPSEYKNIWTPKNEIRLWSVPRKTAEFLRFLVYLRRPRLVLELGTSAGYSSIWIASALRDTGGKLYTIEAARPKIVMAKKYFQEANLGRYIKVIEGDIAAVLKKWNKKIDFVFLDADKHNYFRYLKQLEPHLSKGAMLVADNALNFKHLMKDYLNYVSKSSLYESRLLPFDNGLMVSIKK